MVEIPQSHRDLLDAPFATLATIGPDGRPQLTVVWFLFEDGAVTVSLNTTRKKVRNLLSNPACTILILDLANPLRYLELRGDARLLPDDDYVYADRLGVKYGADIRTFDPPDETRVQLILDAVRVNAVDISG
jgi:PPOX class probable F420-dependent enzyme